MKLPRIRPSSGQQLGCSEFGGINRTPGARLGLWHDARNLSSDGSPTLCVRKARVAAESLEGNTPEAPIVAMVGGDHMVLLDETGTFWCNGHSLLVPYYGNGYFGPPALAWETIITQPVAGAFVRIDPGTGFTADWSALNGLGVDAENQTIEQETVRFRCVEDWAVPEPVWESDLGGSWHSDDPANWGINVVSEHWLDGLEISVKLRRAEAGKVGGGVRLVRMGSRVIDTTNGVWIDAVKLAAGIPEEAEEEPVKVYGRLAVDSFGGGQVTLTMCDIDGKAFSGVVSSATEPQTQAGYWLDSSGNDLALRQWDVSTRAWVQVSSTYIRVDMDEMEQGADVNWTDLKKGDTVQLEATLLPSGTAPEVAKLLTGTHYLYDFTAGPGPQASMLLSGIIPAETVTLSLASISILREYPKMDYVVEAGNRLWGCRYSEAEGINEIYASKLGDASNWEVFQGLSTDSWRASRGTAGAFTGAAVLDGNPLFFRENSLEKVFPSASGAHQIQCYDLEGVEQGAADSLCVIEDRLYYKSRQGVMVYTGTLPRRISDAFGELCFTGGSAARHGRKYCLATRMRTAGEETPVALIFDPRTGDWHIESEAWEGKAVTWQDCLYYIDGGQIYRMGQGNSEGCADVRWFAETGPQGLQISSSRGSTILAEHKWISRIRLRYQMETGARAKVMISYDGRQWLQAARLFGNRMGSAEANIFPRRCDHFRLRLEGTGGLQLWSVTMTIKRSDE